MLKDLKSIQHKINMLLESLENNDLKYIIHFSHDDNKITRSLSELYDRDPNKAKKIIEELNKKGHKRGIEYLENRVNIEKYIKSQFPRLGIKPQSQYPIYGILDIGHFPERFEDEHIIRFPIDKLKDVLTFTIGDSFPVLFHKIDPTFDKKKPPMGTDVLSLDEIIKIGKEELLNRVRKIGKQNKFGSAPDYVECQIWATINYLNAITEGGSSTN